MCPPCYQCVRRVTSVSDVLPVCPPCYQCVRRVTSVSDVLPVCPTCYQCVRRVTTSIVTRRAVTRRIVLHLISVLVKNRGCVISQFYTCVICDSLVCCSERWRSTTNSSIRCSSNSADTFILVITEILPSAIKITYLSGR